MIVLDGLESRVSRIRKIGDFIHKQSPAVWVGATVLLAFLIRFVVVCCAFRGIADPANTHAEFGFEMGWTARSIALGHGFSGPFQPITGPTAIVPPIYPYLLAGIFRALGLYTARAAFVTLTFNSIVSSLTCIPIYAAARESSGERLARWAAFGWAIYPFAVYFSAARVWDYALTSLLFACCFWWAARLHRSVGVRPWILFGVLFGVTALCNPSIVSSLPFLLLIAVWRGRQIGLTRLTHAAVAFFAFALVLLPWTVRNERALHILSPVRDGFWLEFYAGNIGDPTNSNSPSAHPASNPDEMALYSRIGETAYMGQKHALAVANLRNHKAAFLLASTRRFIRFWTGYWSFSPAYLEHEPYDLPNVPFCSTLALFTLIGLFASSPRDRFRLPPFALLVALFPVPYYLTHASMDYRQPIEPELVILSTAGALAVRDRLLASNREAVKVSATELDLVAS